MTDEPISIRVDDGTSLGIISDPASGLIEAPLLEISLQEAHLHTSVAFDANAYIDVKLMLKGQSERQVFGNVVASGDHGLHLKWVFFDPAEEQRLRMLLDDYQKELARSHSKPAPTAMEGKRAPRQPIAEFTPFGDEPATPHVPAQPERVGTRRIVRPRQEAITPFGNPPDPSPKPMTIPGGKTKPADKEPGRSASDLDLVTPTKSQPIVPAPAPAPVEHAPTEHRAGDDSGVAHAQVIIQSTDQFAKIPAIAPADAVLAHNPAAVVRREDGSMDIGASIKSRAKTVRASELAARHERVRVLNMTTIKALIQEAVDEASKLLSHALGENERKRLLEEAEESFQERLKAFQLEKASADERAAKLADQLGNAQRLLDEERKRSISADQFTVSHAGMAEIEASFLTLIERSAGEGKLSDSLEGDLRAITSRVLDEERNRIREKEAQAHSEKIELLEKKIRRLAGNLEDAERQRDEAREIAATLEKMGGQGMSVEQIKQKFQVGLKKDDPDRERKLAVMREVLEQNRELRRKLGLAMNEGAADKPASPPPVVEVSAPVVPEPEESAAETDASSVETDGEPLVNPDDQPWEPVSSEPAVNPDDLPWEPPASAAPADEADERGVKILREYKKFEPPPLHPK